MKKGFSLVESLVVIAIISIVVGIFVFVNNTAKSQAVLDKAQTSLIGALQEARNRSAAGFGEADCKYGVQVEGDKIITLEVDGEGNYNQSIERPFPMGVSADDLTVVFDRLKASPDISEDTTITLKHSSGLQRIITITKDGSINY